MDKNNKELNTKEWGFSPQILGGYNGRMESN